MMLKVLTNLGQLIPMAMAGWMASFFISSTISSVLNNWKNLENNNNKKFSILPKLFEPVGIPVYKGVELPIVNYDGGCEEPPAVDIDFRLLVDQLVR
jgi:hypothetical protein